MDGDSLALLLGWIYWGGSVVLMGFAWWIVEQREPSKPTQYISRLEAPDYYKPSRRMDCSKLLYALLMRESYRDELREVHKLDIADA